ncbi:AsmA family protein [Terracidiphilus gabretensis]|jgi:AsmA protein|uniref:AsmA family protein n=1 Tax=Terracidiphilus gabretensis TaxID=1577687 RepID=UPI00071B90B1|nr:AsmA family protein [Terracidiphilus gabretensis]
MKKRWLMITAGAIAAVLLALVALPFLIDVNRFRPELEAKASEALGREVKLGNLRLSILAGRVIADNIAIADDPAFSQSAFLQAKSVEIGVELKPLIVSRQLNVTEIIIDQPQISILKASDGTYNFSSLGGASHTSQAVQLHNDARLSVARLRVNHGKLTVAGVGSQRGVQVYDDFNISVTDFSATSQFHFELTSKLPGGGDARLSGKAGPIRSANVAATPLDASVAIHDLDLSGYGLIDPASGISGQMSLDGNLSSDGTTAIVSGAVTGTSMTFAPKGKPSPKVIAIQSRAEVDLSTQLVKITQSDIAVGNAKFEMTGTIESKPDGPVANLRLTGKSVPIDDLQAVLPSAAVRLPLGSHLQGGTLSVDFTITGPLASAVAAGHVLVIDTKLVGYNLGEQLGSTAAFAGKAISKPDTSIRRMSCDSKATRAGSTSTNIESDIPDVAYSTGSGTVSPDGALHYVIQSYPSSGVAGGLTKMASVGSGQGYIPVTIVGTVEKPIYVVDTKAAAHILVKQTAKGVVSATGNAISGLFKKKKKDDDKPK